MTKAPGRFSGLVENRKTPATSEPIEETAPIPHPQATPSAKAAAQTKTAVKVAKYKDPDRKGFSFLLNVKKHATASFILKTKRNGDDMSDLVERLLTEWIEKNKD